MKTHPFLVLGIVAVSAVAGYYFRGGMPMPVMPASETQAAAAGEPAAGLEPPQPRRSLAAIEEENEIRRMVEEREEALAEAPSEQPAAIDRQPAVVEKFSAAPFYDELAPHGEWIEADDYGDVWQPAYARDSDWQPYTDGSWAYTEAGWTWDSDEPCGDITCHYGRWVNLVECGWCWVPGHDWAPAWVSWRCNDEFIGWAPLPPCVPWRPAAGIGAWVDACGDLGPGSYCFVPIRRFAAANCRPVLCPRTESATHFSKTRNLTHLVCKPAGDGRSRPVLDGPDVHRIAALSSKDLRYRRLQWVKGSPSRAAKPAGSEVLAVREFVFSPAAGGPERRPKASRQLGHTTVASPWREASDTQTLATARRQVFAEARETFRGLPRLVPPVETRKPAAPRHQREAPGMAKASVIESVREQPAPARPARTSGATADKAAVVARPDRRPEISETNQSAGKETLALSARPRATREPNRDASPTAPRLPQGSALGPATIEPSAPLVSRRLEPASSLAPRQTTRESSTTRTAERLAAQAAREQEARESLRQQQALEAQAARQQREQEPRQQLTRQQEEQQQQEQEQEQEQQRQTLAAHQREQDARDRQASEQRARQARDQAMAEQQQQRAETERQAIVERQRQQAEARQQQEIERRQQIEQARQQAMFEARQQQEAQQREQMEQSRRQAEMHARQAAEQRQRENEARQQQAEAQRRQADENQRRQQLQEAQERAQAARQQQMEEARQRQQAEAGRQREQEAARQRDQEAARQQGGHGSGKGGR